MSIRTRSSFLIGTKKDDYHLVQKVIDVIREFYGNEFSVNDLTALDQFTRSEKKRLKSIFDDNFSIIYAWDAQFDYQDGKWRYRESSYDTEKAMKNLLILLNNKKFSLGATVSTGDLSLIRTLISEWDAMFVREWEMSRGDEAPPYEITWEVLQFISKNMKTRVGEYSAFNFDFVKTFLEAYYDSFDVVFEKIIMGTYKPK
jgi:hypothetical protein